MTQGTPIVTFEVSEGDQVFCEFTLRSDPFSPEPRTASCSGASGSSTVAEEAAAGGTVSTGTAAVTTPTPGAVYITTSPTTGPPPAGLVLIDQQYDITFIPADPENVPTAANPLRLVFDVETTESAESITVFKDGVPVPACTDVQSSAAAPDPCVLSRVDQSGGVEITVLSSTASVWTFAVPETPLFDFAGFFAPVNNLPLVNTVKAGRAIPVKFSLDGDQGLDIFADGYPKSRAIACDSHALLDEIETTIDTAGGSTLTYDSGSDRYHFVWKTQKNWDGCRQLLLKFTDGTTHAANFQFRS